MAKRNQNSEKQAPADAKRWSRIQLEQAVRGGGPGAIAKLREWVSSADAPNEMRALAAALMTSLPDPEVERTLIQTIGRESSGLVLIHVCRALAFIGTEACLKSIERLAKSSKGRLSESAQFAHILVSHRFHRTSPFFKPAVLQNPVLIDGPGDAFMSQRLTAEQLGEAYIGVAQYASMGPIHAEAAIKITCRFQQWIIMFADAIVRNGIGETLSKTPSVLGGILLWSEEHKAWSLSRVVLGGPIDRGRFYVASFRKNGVLDLLGSGSLEERLVQLRAVPRPGALPLMALAYWTGKFVSISGVSGFQRTTKNAVRRIDPPVVRSAPETGPSERR